MLMLSDESWSVSPEAHALLGSKLLRTRRFHPRPLTTH